jgi:hypothetical protein
MGRFFSPITQGWSAPYPWLHYLSLQVALLRQDSVVASAFRFNRTRDFRRQHEPSGFSDAGVASGLGTTEPSGRAFTQCAPAHIRC